MTVATQVRTVGFGRIPDKSRYAGSSDLFTPLPGGFNTFSTPVTGGHLAPVGLS